MQDSAHLYPADTATTVRVKDGRTLTTDGPFIEAKEALDGYFAYEGKDLDAAIELAARIPAARMGGAIEIRPVVERFRRSARSLTSGAARCRARGRLFDPQRGLRGSRRLGSGSNLARARSGRIHADRAGSARALCPDAVR